MGNASPPFPRPCLPVALFSWLFIKFSFLSAARRSSKNCW